MKIQNTKSALAHVIDIIEKLDNDEIDVTKAATYAKLHQGIQGYLNYELKRAITIKAINPNAANQHVREIEFKNFDALPQ